MNNQPKEVAVFKTYTKYNKLKVFGIAVAIIVVAFILLYFPIKTLFTYTITYHLNGGSVYNQELTVKEYKFLQKIEEPKGVKKFGIGENGEEIGYYIDHWSKNEDLSDTYTFGGKMWSSFHLYVKWELGVAVRLHFADGEENSDMSTQDLKGYYEQYIKPGSNYTLPAMYNDKVDTSSLHYGEQLIWYDNPECTGEPFFTKTYINLQESIDIYGKWIDTSSDKFVIQNGTLVKYLGHCNKVMIPSGVTKIKDVVPEQFKTGYGDTIGDQSGENYSVWTNVIGGTNTAKNLQTIYINAEMENIGDCAFRDCKALERIIFLGNKVKTIGKNAFAGCDAIKEFAMPTQVRTISSRAFDGAFNKNSQITLDLSSVERLEDYAFINSHVYAVNLDNVSFIGKNAFAGCGELTKVKISGGNPPTSNVDTSTNSTKTNEEGIFYGVNLSVNVILQIVVPIGKKAEYIMYPYWNMYSSVIVEENI